MKIRYIIYDYINEGMRGTNDTDLAMKFSHSDDHSVVDTEANKVIVNGKYMCDIKMLEDVD